MTKADKEGRRKAPILRFKGFTDDWEQRKLLSNIESIIDYRGKTPKKLGLSWNGEREYPALSAVNVENGKINLSKTEHFGDAYLFSKWMKKALKLGQVILTTEAPVGNVAQIKEKKHYILSQRVIAFETDKNLLDDFLYFLLQRNNSTLLRYSTGGTAKGISQKSLKQVKINLTPNISEQKQISQLLNVVKNLITLYEKKKQLLTQLKQGIVNFLITKNGQKPQLRFSGFNNNWESKSFEKLLNYEQPTKYIVKKADYISQGTPVLTANKSFVLGYTNETNVYQNIPAIIFDDFTLESKYVDFPFMVKSSAIKILTSKNSNLFFIYQLLNNQRFVQEGHSRHYISVVQKKKVLVPSIQEQNKISDLIKQLEDNIELNSNTIVLLKKLKEFLLQNMFL